MDVTIIGADDLTDAAGDGEIRTATSGDPLEGDVVVLAVCYPDARGPSSDTATSSPERRWSTSPTR
jgi:hypothetical protein